MPRRSSGFTPPTALALAVSERRGARTQAEVAREIGVGQVTLSSVERGAPLSLKTAEAIARWLGWPIEQVIGAARKPAA
jgi:DNA-binding XRE family transcriptional regulator